MPDDPVAAAPEHNYEYGREHDGYSHMGIPPACPACAAEPAPDIAPSAALAGIREREQAATPGPWIVYGIGDDEIWSEEPWGHVAETMGNEADARFIADARTKMPRLVAALEAVLALADDAVLMSIDAAGAACAWDLDPAKVCEAITTALTGEERSDG